MAAASGLPGPQRDPSGGSGGEGGPKVDRGGGAAPPAADGSSFSGQDWSPAALAGWPTSCADWPTG